MNAGTGQVRKPLTILEQEDVVALGTHLKDLGMVRAALLVGTLMNDRLPEFTSQSRSGENLAYTVCRKVVLRDEPADCGTSACRFGRHALAASLAGSSESRYPKSDLESRGYGQVLLVEYCRSVRLWRSNRSP